ncbi:MAG: fibrobacter succinogenes major paralogous domain-containing protein [Flavobacteriaceae bacterium]|nr:fibrobacter succinogenes major paralogous domain-containing protein [Flavobacteriaceae bacterium]
MKYSKAAFWIFSILLYSLLGCENQNKNMDTIETTNIKNMEWSITNLKTLTYRNGDSISDSDIYILRDPNTLEILEVFYNFYAIDDVRGLAMHGFHIPEEREWDLLKEKLGDGAVKKLKSKQGWKESETGGNGTDNYGMNIYPIGFARADDEGHNKIYENINAYFWTSTFKEPPSYAGGQRLNALMVFDSNLDYFYDDYAHPRPAYYYDDYAYPTYYFSVRLIKDY